MALLAFESTWYLSGNELPNLSEYQVVSCDLVDLGFDGGDMHTAFKYVVSAPVDGSDSWLIYIYYQLTRYGGSGVCNATFASLENCIANVTG